MISLPWRLALAAKALLLGAIALGFLFIAYASVRDDNWAITIIGGAGFSWLGGFLAWAAGLGFADALAGQARTETHVKVLENRRQGYSMRTPSGRFVEFVLWNPWDPLVPDATYTVTYGRFSGVIVQRPVRTGA